MVRVSKDGGTDDMPRARLLAKSLFYRKIPGRNGTVNVTSVSGTSGVNMEASGYFWYNRTTLSRLKQQAASFILETNSSHRKNLKFTFLQCTIHTLLE